MALAALHVLPFAFSSNATDHSRLDTLHWNELKTGTPLEWPALRFHFSIKRSSTNIYGQTAFDMYANPIVLDNNKNVLYDVYATFTQDKMLHNYTLVNGIAYSESTPFSTGSSSSAPTPLVECSDAESSKLPAINSIVAAISEATTGSSNGNDANSQCTTGSVYKTVFSGVDYAVCVSTTGFTMQGSDMDISVEYLESHINIQPPTMNASADHKCSSKALSTSVTALGHSLLTGEPISTDNTRKLEAAIDFGLDDLSPCSCKPTPRPCISSMAKVYSPRWQKTKTRSLTTGVI